MINISITAEPIAHIGSLPVTNSMLVTLLAIAGLSLGAFLVTRNLRAVPGRIQAGVEMVIEFLLDLIQSIVGSKEEARRFFPFIATFFIFILTVNWLGILPGVGSIGVHEVIDGQDTLVPLFRSSSADLNFTLALALISVISVQIVGIAGIGFWKYAGKFIVLKHFSLKSVPAFLSGLLDLFVGLLELVLEMVKVVSFSFRLFGNVFAGEVLLTVILFLVPFLVPLPFLVLELFMGFIQALVFSLLTIVFMKTAATEAH